MKSKLESRVSKLEDKVHKQGELIESLKRELDGVKRGEYMIYKWIKSKYIKNSTLVVFMHYLKNHRFQKEKKWNKNRSMDNYLTEDKKEHNRKRKNYVLEHNGDTYYLLTIIFVKKMLGLDRMQQCRFLRTLSDMGFVRVIHKRRRRFVFTDLTKMDTCLRDKLEAVC